MLKYWAHSYEDVNLTTMAYSQLKNASLLFLCVFDEIKKNTVVIDAEKETS